MSLVAVVAASAPVWTAFVTSSTTVSTSFRKSVGLDPPVEVPSC
jgi:hypothetical protein